jgi:hypothetical protein
LFTRSITQAWALLIRRTTDRGAQSRRGPSLCPTSGLLKRRAQRRPAIGTIHRVQVPLDDDRRTVCATRRLIGSPLAFVNF